MAERVFVSGGIFVRGKFVFFREIFAETFQIRADPEPRVMVFENAAYDIGFQSVETCFYVFESIVFGVPDLDSAAVGCRIDFVGICAAES